MSDGLYGLDAEIADKLIAKRDLVWEREVMDWISTTVGLGSSFADKNYDVLSCLKNGVVLCKLINTLVPRTVAVFNEENKIRSPLQEVENIQIYLKVVSFSQSYLLLLHFEFIFLRFFDIPLTSYLLLFQMCCFHIFFYISFRILFLHLLSHLIS
jgi:hypothetical protein